MKDWFRLSSNGVQFVTILIIWIIEVVILDKVYNAGNNYLYIENYIAPLPESALVALTILIGFALLILAYKLAGKIVQMGETFLPSWAQASIAFALQILPVILILGVIYLSSSSQPNYRANDAAIKANLSGARAQAELFYDEHNNSYEGACDDQDVFSAITTAKFSAGLEDKEIGGDIISSTPKQPVCHDTTTVYAAQVTLMTNNKLAFCVDNSGRGTTTPYQLTSTEVEDGGETDCSTP